MKPVISIIVCVYNVEATIRRALDSYLAQTFKNFEIVIVVEDDTPDNCLQICEEYAENDSRVSVFSKINEGLASARNYALERIKGEYVIQLDPDDWMDADGLECLYDKAKEKDADMVICDYYHNNKNRQTYTIQKPTALDHNSVLGDLITGKIFGYCWNKLIKVNCYKKNNITFPKEIYGCEDHYSMCCLLKNSIKISYLPKAFYHYVYYPKSLSRYYDENTLANDILARDMYENLLSGTKYEKKVCELKTAAITIRAFMYGERFFSSKDFKKLFIMYENITVTNERSSFLRELYNLSFKGHYQLAHKIYKIALVFKKILNSIKNL